MSNEITKLPITQFSGLDYDNIVKDIENLIKQDPEYNQAWEDFLEANGGKVLIELFAWITDQLASRIDLIANENFISTARDKNSIVKLLRVLGYNFKLPYSSEATVKLTYNKQIPSKTYSLSSYNSTTNVMNLLNIQAKNKNGRLVNFEAIPYSKAEEKFQYIDNNVYINPSQDGRDYIKMYEGKTYVRDFIAETSDNQKFLLPENNIAENSLRVYLIEENQDGQVNFSECLLVETFLEKNAQTSYYLDGSPIPLPYILNVLEDNKLEIEFAPQTLIYPQDRRPQVNDTFKMFYRTTSGLSGDIPSKAINTQKNMVLNFLDGSKESVKINFINENSSSGGKDGENKESAISKAPLEIRTVRKTVTEEDYEIILNQNEDIMKVKSYSWSNAPANIYSVYNEYMGPHEVWNYIVPYKQGWENLKTFEYNDFNWFNFRLQNYFNEPANFINGNSNEVIERNSLVIQQPEKIIDETVNNLDATLYNTTSLSFKNYVVLPFSSYDEVIGNEATFRVKITPKKNTESYFNLIENIIEDDTTSNDYLKIEQNKIRLEKDINSFVFSSRVISETGVSFINNSKTIIKLSIDDEEEFFIHNFVNNNDLDTLNTNKVNYLIEDIRDELNSKIEIFEHKKRQRIGFNFVNNKTTKSKRDFENIEIINTNISSANFRIELIDNALNSETYDFSISLDGSIEPIEMTGLLSELNSVIGASLKNIVADWNVDANGYINDIYIYSTNNDTINIIDGDAAGDNRFFDNLNATIELNSTGQQSLSALGGLVDTDNSLNSKTEEYRNNYYTYKTKTPEFYFGFGDDNNVSGGNGNNTRIVSESEFKALEFKNILDELSFRVQITNIDDEVTVFPNDEVSEDFTINISSITTIEQLVNNLNSVIIGRISGSTAEFIIDGSLNEIVLRIKDNDTAKNYKAISILPPTTGDYLLAAGAIKSNIVDSTTLDTAIPFSSYSYNGYLTYKDVFSVVSVDNDKYLKITSPKVGDESMIVFSVYGGNTSDTSRDISDVLFGVNYSVNGDMQKSYGKQSLTFMYEISDPSSLSFEQSIIWENGSINFDREMIDSYYLQYIISQKSNYKIGSYFAESFNESDSKYKELPKSLFPTYYIKDSEGNDTDVVDLMLSDYVLAFSSEPVSASSVYSLLESDDPLAGIKKVDNPYLLTRVLGQTDTDGIAGFDEGVSYSLELRIDGFDDIIPVEFVGGNGTRISALARDINETIKLFFIERTEQNFIDAGISFFNDDYQRARSVYTSYDYATIVSEINASGVVEKRIKIESPTFFNYSKVEVKDITTSSALANLFDDEPVWTDSGEVIINSADNVGYVAIPKGDYYISYDQNEQAMYLNKSLVTNVPDNLFYINYIYDRRNQDVLLDEDVYRDYLSQYKIVGIENKFKPTKFSTFDVKGTIYYNKVFTEEYVREKVETKLYSEYNLLRAEHGNTISKSKFLSYIHEAEKNAISSVEITYFGKDASDPNTNKLNFIDADFDEIIVLSDELFSSGTKTKGLLFEYRGVS